jgi:hypothetical protein
MPVAIETSRGLLVAALRATGRAIYASWLRTITVLARAAQDTIWRRTKAGPLALSTSRSGRGPSDPAAEVRVFGSGVDDIDTPIRLPSHEPICAVVLPVVPGFLLDGSHPAGSAAPVGDHPLRVGLGAVLTRGVAHVRDRRIGGWCEPVSLEKLCRPYHRELRPSVGHGVPMVVGADIPAANPAGDAGAARGDRQRCPGAHRCLMTQPDPDAQAVLILTDDFTQCIHRGPLAERHQDTGGQHRGFARELRRAREQSGDQVAGVDLVGHAPRDTGYQTAAHHVVPSGARQTPS